MTQTVTISRTKLLISAALAVSAALVNTTASGESGPPHMAHTPYGGLSVSDGWLKPRVAAGMTVSIPLTAPKPTNGTYSWCARVAVGAVDQPTLNSMSCTLYATGATGVKDCVEGGSGKKTPVGSSIMMLLPPTKCPAAFLECTIPFNTWLGQVTWLPFADAAGC